VKVYISADIEGISGVVGDRQTTSSGMDYQRSRKLMALDVNAAIEGALEAGATEIVVNDSHGGMNNLWPEDIHPEAKLLIGRRKPLSMMQGIDSSFDAAMFVGYHGRVGTRFGTLAHTYTGTISNVRLNGQLVGEVQINGGVAGFYGVPLVLVTGDEQLSEQVKETNPDIETAIVKYAVTKGASLCLHPERARLLIKEAAKRSVERCKTIRPIVYAPPIQVDVEFPATQIADMLERVPRVERVDDLTLRYVAEQDYIEAFKAFLTLMSLSGSAKEV